MMGRKLTKLSGLTRLYKLYQRLRVVRWSPYENVYYCCTQRTASQWFKAVFSDPMVFKYTGLEVFPYTQLVSRRQDAHFDGPLPKHVIGTHLYIGYPTYLTIPKPENYRTFFILRDPRDIVVSWYFSTRYSHPSIGLIPERRKKLENLSLSDGLKYTIDALERSGLFWSQRSWIDNSEDHGNVRIFRYEDFAHENWSFLKQLFDYLNIVIPEDEFFALYDRHRFERYAEGRTKGMEEPKSHYRKGMSGDWVNYFDPPAITHFRRVTKDLLEVLGYPG